MNRDNTALRNGATMRRFKYVALLLFGIAVGGCDEPSAVEIQAETLQTQLAEWKKLNYTNYEYTFSQFCFCPSEMSKSRIVKVQNNLVVAVTETDGSAVPPNQLSWYITIDQLYQRLLDHAKIQNAFFTTIDFDQQLHYPKVAEADIRGVADGGFTTYASNLKRN